VKDTGIGIPSHKQKEIFNAFSQVDSSCTRRFGGTGLGLAICKHLVEAMGGAIWVESEVGQGSTFIFTVRSYTIPDGMEYNMNGGDTSSMNEDALSHIHTAKMSLSGLYRQTSPVGMRKKFQMSEDTITNDCCNPTDYDSNNEDPNNTLKTDGKSDTKKRKHIECESNIQSKSSQNTLNILVAEDNSVNQIIIQKILTKFGHQVTVVSNGAEAVELVKNTSFHLILMDLQMPQMGGLEAAKIITSMDWNGRIKPKIVALTASAVQEDKVKSLEAGMDGYLLKPLKLEEVKRVCDSL